jgi:hypothetical protein
MTIVKEETQKNTHNCFNALAVPAKHASKQRLCNYGIPGRNRAQKQAHKLTA